SGGVWGHAGPEQLPRLGRGKAAAGLVLTHHVSVGALPLAAPPPHVRGPEARQPVGVAIHRGQLSMQAVGAGAIDLVLLSAQLLLQPLPPVGLPLRPPPLPPL